MIWSTAWELLDRQPAPDAPPTCAAHGTSAASPKNRYDGKAPHAKAHGAFRYRHYAARYFTGAIRC